MAEESPQSSATRVERPRRFLILSSSHGRSQSVACTRMLWNFIASAITVQLLHEQAQRLCKVIVEQRTVLHLPAPAMDASCYAADFFRASGNLRRILFCDELAVHARPGPAEHATAGRHGT
ncbi:hypothetical protein MTO96_041116 [Rhipicephalus appendiculatus]